MKSIVIKAMLVTVAVGVAMFALAGTASAAHVSAVITMPDQATVGQRMAVEATLRSTDRGLPVTDTLLTFYTDGSFGDVSGRIELGQAVTDENGVATLTYVPRVAGEHEIRVEYAPPGSSELESATAGISVADGTQLHRSTAGVQIPGLNVWLLIALVSGVWAILFGVGLQVIAIARAGSDAEAVPKSALAPADAETRAAPSRSGTSGAR